MKATLLTLSFILLTFSAIADKAVTLVYLTKNEVKVILLGYNTDGFYKFRLYKSHDRREHKVHESELHKIHYPNGHTVIVNELATLVFLTKNEVKVILKGYDKDGFYKYCLYDGHDRIERKVHESKLHKIHYSNGHIVIINKLATRLPSEPGGPVSIRNDYVLELWKLDKAKKLKDRRRVFEIGTELQYKKSGNPIWKKGLIYELKEDTVIMDLVEYMHQKDTIPFADLIAMKGKHEKHTRNRVIGWIFFTILTMAAVLGFFILLIAIALAGIFDPSGSSEPNVLGIAIGIFLPILLAIFLLARKPQKQYKIHEKWHPKVQKIERPA